MVFNDINDTGQIVGEYQESSSITSGLLYTVSGGTLTNINPPGIANPNTSVIAVTSFLGKNALGNMLGYTGAYPGGNWID